MSILQVKGEAAIRCLVERLEIRVWKVRYGREGRKDLCELSCDFGKIEFDLTEINGGVEQEVTTRLVVRRRDPERIIADSRCWCW